MYENVHVLIHFLQIQFYIYCYIQDRHTENEIRSQWDLTDILQRRSLAVRILFFLSKFYILFDKGRKGYS